MKKPGSGPGLPTKIPQKFYKKAPLYPHQSCDMLWVYAPAAQLSQRRQQQMRGIILYHSKYGATCRYAQMLAQQTGFVCRPVKETQGADLAPFDTVVFGGGIYASGIGGLPQLKKLLPQLQGKRLFLFCVGASPYDKETFQQLREHNLQGELAQAPLFYCRGAWDEEAMTFTDRTLCRLLQRSLAKRDPATYEPWQAALMEGAGKGACDWSDPAYLVPLLEALGDFSRP